MDSKSKVKKFLAMLRNAQNTAFVGLVCDNLRVELQQKPWKALQILDFLVKEVPRANSDFTRLKIAEGLIPLLAEQFKTESLLSILAYADNDKRKQKLADSLLFLDPLAPETDRAFFSLQDLLKLKKSLYTDLLENYQPLLAELNISDSDSSSPAASNNKETMKQIFMDGALGGRVKTDKLKLSDFIDESFFEEVEAVSHKQAKGNATKQLKQVRELMAELKRNPQSHILVPSQPPQKRVKGVSSDGQKCQMLVMCPQLAIVVRAMSQDALVDNDWKVRQAAASQLRIALSDFMALEYYRIGLDTYGGAFSIIDQQKVSVKEIARALLPQLVTLIVKDNFNDFEELKVITPVRDEALNLLVSFLPHIPEDISQLLQTLPTLLKSIDQVASDSWITKYNFFTLLKGLFLSKDEAFRSTVFQMFSRVLIESLLNLEDEVRILVTDVINMVLPLMLSQPEWEKQVAYLLKNLQKNLQQSDEIESSAISVFALINKIIDQAPSLQLLQIKFDLKTYCPFNFHQIVNVRYSYLQILNKCLKAGTISSQEDLTVLLRLTLQSLAMERARSIVKLNLENLRILGQIIQRETLQGFIDQVFNYEQSLPCLLYSYQMTSFESFMFFESKNFESIQGDYFKVVFRPVNPDEITIFYFGKVKNMAKALSIMMSSSPEVAAQIRGNIESYLLPPQNLPQGMPTPIHEAHLLYLLVHEYLLRSAGKEFIDPISLGNFVNSFLVGFQEENVSLLHFKDSPRLQTVISLLYDLLVKAPQLAVLMERVQPLFQMFNQCQFELRLVNLGGIQSLVEGSLLPLFESEGVTDTLQECFSELRGLIAQLVDYAATTCTRVRQMSASLHLKLVQNQLAPITNSLNTIIKPILNQVKKESVVFLQNLACKSTILLIDALIGAGKYKPAQQVLQLIIKDLESLKFGEGSGDANQDRGLKALFKHIQKAKGSLLDAFNGFLTSYLQQEIGYENATAYARVLLFTLETLSTSPAPPTQHPLIISRLLSILSLQELPQPETPSLCLLTFRLFSPHRDALVSSLVTHLENQHLSAFDSLTKLMDDLQASGSSGFLAYLACFVIPVIQNIQNSQRIYGDNKQVTLILAQLLSLLPLNLASLQPQSHNQQQQEEEEKTPTLMAKSAKGLSFLQVFLNSGGGPSQQQYQLQIPLKAGVILREYQRLGITWMASLGQYNLNCALCDDMGLGKTLQSMCVVLNEAYVRRRDKKGGPTLSLIVCPTTITYNWRAEIKKYFYNIRVGIYEGSSDEKRTLLKNCGGDTLDVIIISYEKLRGEIKSFQAIPFFYVILDEGHIIKNAKAKTTIAVKSLQCEKKLVLTGTPLQNKVSELWSIFDFLMPGFLEEESVFNKKYNQYLTSNIKRLSEKLEETQSFLQALKSLKKRIAPFILRRTKDQVLKELPPKIIQDVVCKMTSFQEYVHGIVEKYHPITQTINQTQGTSTQAKDKQAGKHVLQNLIMHRKVCNHPTFVASDLSSRDKNIAGYLEKKSQDEQDSYELSGKLLGLVDKLVECEIIEKQGPEEGKGAMQESSSDGLILVDLATTSAADNRKHRALIFCQMGTFLRMIVDQVLKRFKIPYLELLSSNSPKERLELVERFNADESLRVMILTTAVGGLGLTLTGADTVIFAEHDWNPMRDLQAIDRAHRIGQTRQVCVYRLIMQDTLEEKIMNLQRFKENLARSLVQSKDASSEAASQMELTDLLSSFQEHSAFNDERPKKGALPIPDKIISGIEEIWQGGAFSVEDL